MQYFDVPGAGFIAFRRKWNKNIVLGDPVCSSVAHEYILNQYLSRFPRSTFVQVSGRTASLLHHRYGLYGTQMGQEMHISLADWSLKGRKKEVIRRARNRAADQGIHVTESSWELNGDEILDRWRSTRKVSRREIQFLIRPRDIHPSHQTRFFYAWKSDEPIAFIYLDPIYRNREIVSYVPNISCANEEFRQGIFYVIMSEAMERLRQEDIPNVSLGLIPFALDDPALSHECQHVRNVLGRLFQQSWFYNFQGIHFTKMRFCGELTPTYFCHNRVTPLADALRILKLARVI